MSPRLNGILRLLLILLLADVLIGTLSRLGQLVDLLTDAGPRYYVGGTVLLCTLILMLLSYQAYTHQQVASDRADQDRGELLAVRSASSDWLWRATPDLVVTASNPAVGAVLGYYPHEVVGGNLFDHVHPDDLLKATAAVRAARSAGNGWSDLDLRWLHRDGRTVHLRGAAAPILDSEGTLIGYHGGRRPMSPAGSASDLFTARRRVEVALTDRQVRMALQPIVDIEHDTWTGVEALARFPDGRGPDLWFAEAHVAGLGVELELLAIESAVALLPQLSDHVSLSLNASPAMILDPRLRRALLPLGPALLPRVILEITEHAAVSAYDEIHDALLALREDGMRLAVDDTGAGYASFTHVLRLRPDIVKLDRSLIAGIDTDPALRAFVTAIVLLALALDASIIAEGVETSAELETLRSLGVAEAQGYFFAKPTCSPAQWGSWPARDWLSGTEASATSPVPLTR